MNSVHWTKYCKDIYNFKLNPDCYTFQNNTHPSEMEQTLQILKSEVEKAINCMKNGKLLGMNNVSSELTN